MAQEGGQTLAVNSVSPTTESTVSCDELRNQLASYRQESVRELFRLDNLIREMEGALRQASQEPNNDALEDDKVPQHNPEAPIEDNCSKQSEKTEQSVASAPPPRPATRPHGEAVPLSITETQQLLEEQQKLLEKIQQDPLYEKITHTVPQHQPAPPAKDTATHPPKDSSTTSTQPLPAVRPARPSRPMRPANHLIDKAQQNETDTSTMTAAPPPAAVPIVPPTKKPPPPSAARPSPARQAPTAPSTIKSPTPTTATPNAAVEVPVAQPYLAKIFGKVLPGRKPEEPQKKDAKAVVDSKSNENTDLLFPPESPHALHPHPLQGIPLPRPPSPRRHTPPEYGLPQPPKHRPAPPPIEQRPANAQPRNEKGKEKETENEKGKEKEKDEKDFENWLARKSSVDRMKEDYVDIILSDSDEDREDGTRSSTSSLGSGSGSRRLSILDKVDLGSRSAGSSQTIPPLSLPAREEEADEGGSLITFRDFLLTTPPPAEKSKRPQSPGTYQITKIMSNPDLREASSPVVEEEEKPKSAGRSWSRSLSRIKRKGSSSGGSETRFRTHSFYEPTEHEKMKQQKKQESRLARKEKQQKEKEKKEGAQDNDEQAPASSPSARASALRKKLTIPKLRFPSTKRNRSKTVGSEHPQSAGDVRDVPFKAEQQKDPSPSNQNDNSNHNDVPIVAAQDNQSSESKSPEESSIKPAENTTDLKSSFETLSATLRNDPTLGENELSQAMNNGAMQINVMKETRGYLTMRKGPDIKKEKTFYFVLKRNTMFYYEKEDSPSPAGKISLAGALLEPLGEREGHGVAICDAGGKRLFVLVASTHQEFIEWLDTLQACSIAGMVQAEEKS